MKTEVPYVIAVDFDGTLFETDYPAIIKPIMPTICAAIQRQRQGAKLVLWTMREGAALDQALEAYRKYGLEFDAVNDNIQEYMASAAGGNQKGERRSRKP